MTPSPKRKKRTPGAPKPINGALLDVAHTAAYLGITERSLRARIARHQIPFRRWNGRIMFRRVELDQFLERLAGCSLAEAIENTEENLVDFEQLPRARR